MNNKKPLIVGTISFLTLLVLTLSFTVFSGRGDTPPSLDITGSKFQGFIGDFEQTFTMNLGNGQSQEVVGTFIKIEDSDEKTDTEIQALEDEFGEPITLSAGKMAYFDTDQKRIDILKNSVLEEGTLCFTVSYEPRELTEDVDEETRKITYFNLTPFGVYGNLPATQKDANADIKANTIQAVFCAMPDEDDENTLNSVNFATYGVNDGSIQPQSFSFDAENALAETWYLSLGTEELVQEYLDECSEEIDSIWVQNGHIFGDFQEAELDNFEMVDGFHMLWVKTSEDFAGCQVEELDNTTPESEEDTEEPSEVTNLTITNENGTIKLSWDEATDNTEVTGYQVHYGTESVTEPGENYENSVDVGNVTEYEFTDLQVGETYYFSVIAYDAEGNESTVWAEEVEIEVEEAVEDTEQPIISSIEVIDEQNVIVNFNEKVKLSTNNAEDLTIVKSEDNTSIIPIIETTLGDNNEGVSDAAVLANISENFESGVTYYILETKIVDESDNEVDLENSEREFDGYTENTPEDPTPEIDEEPPTDISTIEVTEVRDQAVKLTWLAATDNVEVTGYEVHYGKTSVTQPGELYDEIIDAGDTLEYEVTGLENDIEYFFTVIAYDAEGNESQVWAPEVSATPKAPEEPNQEPEQYAVILNETGSSKVSVITALRNNSNLGLKESKDLVEQDKPVVLAEGLSESEAIILAQELIKAGASVEVPDLTIPAAPEEVEEEVAIFLIDSTNAASTIDLVNAVRTASGLSLEESRLLINEEPSLLNANISEALALEILNEFLDNQVIATIIDQEQIDYTQPISINLTNIGPSQVAVISVMRSNDSEISYSTRGLAELKDLTDEVVAGEIREIYNSIDSADALKIVYELEEAGASIQITQGTNIPSATDIYSVSLTDVGPAKIEVIKVVRNYTGLSLADTKNLVEGSLPALVKEQLSAQEAEELKSALNTAGAGADINQ